MITTCAYLGIYPNTIENVVNDCEEIMARLGFDDNEIDDMNEYAKDEFEDVGCLDDITNSIIRAYYGATEYMIHEKYPFLRVNYYVDCGCSSFDVDDLPRMAEDEIREDWEKALNSMSYSDIAKEIRWGFFDEDLRELMRLHQANVQREKIEDLLDDCNFHEESGNWSEGNYILRSDDEDE